MKPKLRKCSRRRSNAILKGTDGCVDVLGKPIQPLSSSQRTTLVALARVLVPEESRREVLFALFIAIKIPVEEFDSTTVRAGKVIFQPLGKPTRLDF